MSGAADWRGAPRLRDLTKLCRRDAPEAVWSVATTAQYRDERCGRLAWRTARLLELTRLYWGDARKRCGA